LSTKLLRASRERPRSRRIDNSCDEIARLSLALGLETTATADFI